MINVTAEANIVEQEAIIDIIDSDIKLPSALMELS
tara:strand:- start:708 stop:812 length:105 start_codon:yes stop_codon:yes gene_type:complete